MKLLIPNTAIILISLLAFTGGIAGTRDVNTGLEYLVISLLIVGTSINFMFVRLALRPVKDIQEVAEQIASGNMEARVQPSIIADVGLSQLATTLNETLEYLAEARERIRERGAKVIYAQERERVLVARELHESIGQTLAAASYQAAAAARLLEGQAAEEYAIEINRLLRLAMEDLRNVSRDLHPRVADDLGLPAALEALARATMNRSSVDVRLSVKGFNEPVSSSTGSTIYRIAEQALRNIESNASGGNVRISVSSDRDDVMLEINDDCSPPLGRTGIMDAALAAQAEKVALLGGELVISSNFLGGTRVSVRLRRQQEAA
jgi:signal transduction histidine kinase